MTEHDAHVRLFVYRHFVDEGNAPTRAEVARHLSLPRDDIDAAFERLADGKALVLQPESREVLMAEPFSAIPTAFRVETAIGAWWKDVVFT